MEHRAPKAVTGGLDVTVPVSARIWSYWSGGKDYFQVDKAAGDDFAALFPGIRPMARASRLFLGRAVRYLAGEAGVRQFLDIGPGLPSTENTHEVAQSVAPDARVVYADNDPLVMSHARALLTGVSSDATGYIEGDLRDPVMILAVAREKLDFTKPVAIMLMGVMGHIGNPAEHDDEYALSLVECLKEELPAGGYLVLRDATDTSPEHLAAVQEYAATGAVPYRLRSPKQIIRFFDGLEPVEPGIVPVQQWRPDERSASLPQDINMWGGVACRPPALSRERDLASARLIPGACRCRDRRRRRACGRAAAGSRRPLAPGTGGRRGSGRSLPTGSGS